MTTGYLPGDRWLVVAGPALAYLDASVTDALRLWQVLSAGGDARAALDVLVRSAVDGPDGGLARLGSFVLAESTGDGMRVLCRGIDGVTVRAVGAEPAPVGGSDLVGWSEVVVPSGCELVVGPADSAELLPVPGGVVRAAALRWRPAQTDPDRSALAQTEPDRSTPPPLPTLAPPPPLPTLAPPPPPLPTLAPPPPFVPAPEMLPPLDREDAQRTIEETRYDVQADLAGQDEAVAEPVRGAPAPGTTGAPAHREDVAPDANAVTATAGNEPVPPPIDAVPGASGSRGTGGGDIGDRDLGDRDIEGGDIDGAEGDHDGLTQLAEDLPVGYSPPPVTDEIPPGAVLAVLCPSGHANAPHSSACRLCGRSIDRADPVPVQRPVLARIRLSTGDVVDLDRPVVLGRSPYASRVSASELPRLVTVPSPHHDISRAHVQIRAADWQLVLADLDSTNGTAVQPPGQAQFRLHPGQEIVVEPGWSVDLGDGVGFVVEALS